MSLSNNSTILNNILTKVNNLPSISDSSQLNFKVVGGTTEPSNRTENMIWVNTSTTISGWVFSPTEPTSPSPNSVWICVGSASNTGFNAIMNNGIELYPIAVNQYINGAWKYVTAKIRKNGQWIDLWDGRIYTNGDECTDYTGGWATDGYTSEYTLGGTVTKNANSIYVNGGTNIMALIGTQKAINLSNAKTLYVDWQGTGSMSIYSIHLRITKTKYVRWEDSIGLDFGSSGSRRTDTLDISGLDGEYYVSIFGAWNSACNGYMYSIRVE